MRITEPQPSPLIRTIEVSDLFGRYSYDIKSPASDGGDPYVLLLQGDNGAGKTTLLRLTYHLLSTADNAGHFTHLARTKFKSFKITLNTGHSVSAERPEPSTGAYTIFVRFAAETLITVPVTPGEDLRVRRSDETILSSGGVSWVRTTDGQLRFVNDADAAEEMSGDTFQTYREFLTSQSIQPIYLADDRTLSSDDQDYVAVRKRVARQLGLRDDQSPTLADLAAVELRTSVDQVESRVRDLTIGGQRIGSESGNTVYLNVLRRIAAQRVHATNNTAATADDQGADFLIRLASLETRSPGYERYGLTPDFEFGEFRQLFGSLQASERRELAAEVLTPYLESLEARFDALSDAKNLLDSLIPTINEFFEDKFVGFIPRTGLRFISNDGDELDLASLSSGERQLLILLATTLLAGQQSRLFIIDEPELSLGIEWQRRIVNALVSVSKGSGIQFLIATHSAEIMTGHFASLATMRDIAQD